MRNPEITEQCEALVRFEAAYGGKAGAQENVVNVWWRGLREALDRKGWSGMRGSYGTMRVALRYAPEDIARFLAPEETGGDIELTIGYRLEIKAGAGFKQAQFDALLGARGQGEIRGFMYWFGKAPTQDVGDQFEYWGVDWYIIPGM